MAEVIQGLADKVALSCNILASQGHSDMILGHVSARLPNQEQLHMKPRGLGLEEVRAEDIIVIDFEGNQLAGERERHSEYPIHTEICRARPEINCVVHTHPPFATALGAAGGDLHPIGHEGALFVNLPVFTETTLLIRASDQGEAVANCLGKARAILLQNHGVVVVGQSIEEATIYAILLEKASRMELLCRQFGSAVWGSEEESQRKVEQAFHPKNIQAFWKYFARKL